MNYLSSISHRILFFGQFWPIFILEAGYHFEKYRTFVALQRRDSHVKESPAGHWIWSAEWPAQTLLLTITSEFVIASPLFSSPKTGLALQDPSPHRAPVHHGFFTYPGWERNLSWWRHKDASPLHPHSQEGCFEENTSTEMSLKSQREKLMGCY